MFNLPVAIGRAIERIVNPKEPAKENAVPRDDVLSAKYQHRVFKAIHDAEIQEMAEREASAEELRKGNTVGAKRHLQMAKLLENDRTQTDIKNGQAIVISFTEKIRSLLPAPIELPSALADSEFITDFTEFSDEATVSAETLRELEENAKAMEDRDKSAYVLNQQPETERLLEDE